MTGTRFTMVIAVLFLNSGYLPHNTVFLMSRVSLAHKGSLPIIFTIYIVLYHHWF